MMKSNDLNRLASFKEILHLIQDNSIFQNCLSSPQTVLNIQLRLASFQLGHNRSVSKFVHGTN